MHLFTYNFIIIIYFYYLQLTKETLNFLERKVELAKIGVSRSNVWKNPELDRDIVAIAFWALKAHSQLNSASFTFLRNFKEKHEQNTIAKF